MPFEDRRRWGEVKDFIKDRVRRSQSEHDDTSASVLFAHYRRWCCLSNVWPLSDENFVAKFESATKLQPSFIHGHRVYGAMIVIPEKNEEPDEPKVPEEPKRRGRVKAKEDVVFRSEILKRGTEVPWMEPTDYEKKQLESKGRNRQQDALSWLVIEFNGRRRYIPGNTVEKLHE